MPKHVLSPEFLSLVEALHRHLERGDFTVAELGLATIQATRLYRRTPAKVTPIRGGK